KRSVTTGVAPVVSLTGGTLEFNNTTTTAAQAFQADLTNTGSTLVTKPNAVLQVAVGSNSPNVPANFDMESGSWNIDIGSDTLLGADWFNVANGTGKLKGGTLNINYLSGFSPVVGHAYRILRASMGTELAAGAITIAGMGAGGWVLQEAPITNVNFPLDE